MSDANSKPVAGASEPHELEERAVKAACEAHSRINQDPITCEFPGCGCVVDPTIARAVLALVRQEQEKAAWNHPHFHFADWWLSHTAKETSNG